MSGTETDIMDRLVLADCRQYLQTVPRDSVALVATDPPYNIGFDYDGEYDDKRSVQDYLDWCGEWLRAVYDVLHVHGSCWIAMGPAMVSEVDVLAKRIGFRKRSQVIWHYTFGINCTRKLTPSSTHWLYYTKHRTKYVFNKSERVPSARQLVYNDARASTKGRLPDDVWILRPQWAPDGFRPEGDVWYNSRIAGTFNERVGTPNQMPEQLMGRIIRLSSDPGQLVLDPFAGSATTLAVAKKLGRHYTGCEQSEAFYKLGAARLENAKDGDALAGKDPGE